MRAQGVIAQVFAKKLKIQSKKNSFYIIVILLLLQAQTVTTVLGPCARETIEQLNVPHN